MIVSHQQQQMLDGKDPNPNPQTQTLTLTLQFKVK